MANPPASTASSAAAPKPTSCLCSPTSHPGSFRCSRHRSPRGLPSSSGRAAPTRLSSEGVPGRGEGRSGGGARAKGRSVRAHLLQNINPPSGRDHRRSRDFQPRPSRLRLMNM